MHLINRAWKYLKQKLRDLKGEIDKSTIIIKLQHPSFNNWGNKWDIENLSNAVNPVDLIGIYRKLYAFFSNVFETFIKKSHILVHKVNAHKLEIIQVIQMCSLMTVESGIHKRNITGKFPNVWKLNNIALTNAWIKVEMKGEIRKCLSWIKMNTQHINMRKVPLKPVLKGNL